MLGSGVLCHMKKNGTWADVDYRVSVRPVSVLQWTVTYQSTGTGRVVHWCMNRTGAGTVVDCVVSTGLVLGQ